MTESAFTSTEVDYVQFEGFRPLSLDLRLPGTHDAPLIVFLHGGGWTRGTRRVFLPGLRDAESFDRIVHAGFAVASCDYRLSGEARFPAQLQDVDAALAWIRTEGVKRGLDTDRLVLWGVSAGATLAALTGLRRSDVRGVVDWFGPADMFAMAEHDRTVSNGSVDPASTREARWLGAPPEDVPDLARQASPALQVHSGAPPFHIAHGSADDHVPFSQSQRLAAALDAVGADVELTRVEGAGHFWQGVADTTHLFDSALAFATRVTSRP